MSNNIIYLKIFPGSLIFFSLFTFKVVKIKNKDQLDQLQAKITLKLGRKPKAYGRHKLNGASRAKRERYLRAPAPLTKYRCPWRYRYTRCGLCSCSAL